MFKITNLWTSRPVKEQKENTFLHQIDWTLQIVLNNQTLLPPQTLALLKDITYTEKPAEEEVIKRQKSLFYENK